MPHDVQSIKNNTGRYRAHPDIAIGVPASLRDLPARDDGRHAANHEPSTADIGDVEFGMLMKSEGPS